jgi:anti-sigma B factor antagonist
LGPGIRTHPYMPLSANMSGVPGDFRLTASLTEEKVLLVEARGELDIATTPALRERLEKALDEGHTRIVVDLSEVSFIDSVGLASIVNARHRMEPDGRMAIVADPSSYATLIIEVSGVDALLPVLPTRDQAVAAVGVDG